VRAGSWWLVAGSSLVVALGTANAQATATIRGEVVQPDATTPAAGVVVIALDSAGNEVARSLSGQLGSYQLTVAAPSTYTLRALRIGYRPTTIPAVTVSAGEAKAIRIVLAGVAVQLDSVRVEGNQGSCRITADVGRFVGSMWEQARTVLLASTLSAGQRPFEATLALYRHFTPTGARAIEAETLEVVRRTTTSGFVSVSAEELAATGYVVVNGSRISYHAPDANALLSPLFASTHCFDVKLVHGEHPDWVGITFRPSTRRSGIAEIEGTLWLDRSTAELRTMEYRYVNLPRNAANGDAGGEIVFMRLLTGDWIVSRWVIRTPETEQVSGMGRITTFRPIGRRVVGGITQAIRQDGAELYRNRGASVTFVLKARDNVNHGRGAMIGVDGLDRGALTDSGGGITITGLTEARHKAHIQTSLMEWVGAPAMIKEFDASYDKPNIVEVVLPRIEELRETACSKEGLGGVFFGQVRNAEGKLVQGARVSIDYVVFAGPSRRRRGSASPPPRTARDSISKVALSDRTGQWRICAPSVGGALITVHAGETQVFQAPVASVQQNRYTPIVLRIP
jgi:hypothetical protein